MLDKYKNSEFKEIIANSLPPKFKLHSDAYVYEIKDILGSSSFCITYLATGIAKNGNGTSSQRFAIKEYFVPRYCHRENDGATVFMMHTVSHQANVFFDDAYRLMNVCRRSRNIVNVTDVFRANETVYYVMEFLDGEILSKCTETEAVSVVFQIAKALDEMHHENVFHLNLMPDNIVMVPDLDKNGERYPVLIDFGLTEPIFTMDRSFHHGPIGYTYPGQISGDVIRTPINDIYALGAVLYFLVTNEEPPLLPRQEELKEKLDGKVSLNVEKAILNAMKLNGRERTPSIRQFCKELVCTDSPTKCFSEVIK